MLNLTDQQKAILRIVLIAVLGIISILTGVTVYDKLVIQPREQGGGAVAPGPEPQPTAAFVRGAEQFKAVRVQNSLDVGGPVHTDSTLSVAGAADLASLTVPGATALNGGLAMDTTKFVVADTSGNTTIAGTLTVTGAQTLIGNTSASGYVTATTGLAIGAGQFSGAVRYGTSATYTKDAPITHGFATTPTACLLWPAEITATVTMTSTMFSSDTANHANPVYWMCGK